VEPTDDPRSSQESKTAGERPFDSYAARLRSSGADREEALANMQLELALRKLQHEEQQASLRANQLVEEAKATERQAQRRLLYGLITVLSGLVVLGVLYGVTLYFFTSKGTPSEQIANNIVASMGVVTGVIGSLVSAYFGIQLGSAGRERAESQRDQAAASSLQPPPPRPDEPELFRYNPP
jgi:hypothetical protein